ncbi:MAG: PEP-CTERM sorting domain-containing protein [Pseudomonadota bacterium]|nr:PEP-CTERM sorting domain-containing protein [Pseudomonadota bacterium]
MATNHQTNRGLHAGLAALLPCAAALCAASPGARASSVDLIILGAQYSTDLTVDETYLLDPSQPPSGSNLGSHVLTQASTSSTPLNTQLHGVSDGYQGPVYAASTADTFAVASGSYDSTTLGGYTMATAETALNFKPLTDGMAPLTFQFAAATVYTGGFVSLYDDTTDQSLFLYSWGGAGYPPGNVPLPWTPNFAALTPDPLLLASHTYTLTLNAKSDAAMDSNYVSLGVSGFRSRAPIPEPSTYALLLAGLAVAGAAARRRRAVSTRPGVHG